MTSTLGFSAAGACIKLAKANFEVSEKMISHKISPEWYMIILYYAALHYVNAYLILRGKTIPTHHRSHSSGSNPGRNDLLRDLIGHDGGKGPSKKIFGLYSALEQRSFQFRYEPEYLNSLTSEQAESYKNNYTEIKNTIDKILADPSKFN
jgi:hypothetical protein